MSSQKASRKLKLVETGGSPYETGYGYGETCPEIRSIIDTIYELSGGREAVARLMQQYLHLYLPAALEYAPDIVEEMKGIAAGAKVEFEQVFFLNISYELAVPGIMGCTSFAISGDATGTGDVIAGQNFDYLAPWQEHMVALKMKPQSGPEIFAVAPAGCLGLFGLNAAGLSVNLNLLRNKASLSPCGGVPTHIILRKTLTSENIGGAIGTIASAKGRSAKHYLLASGQGDIVSLETTTDDIEVLYPTQGIFTHANHFETARFKNTDLAPQYWPDSYIRSQRLRNLLERYHGRLSIDTMKELLADHNNYPNSICRHPDPGNPLPMARNMKTLISIISIPGQGKAYIAVGNPCENDYEEYQVSQ